jgi:hypothetical protein
VLCHVSVSDFVFLLEIVGLGCRFIEGGGGLYFQPSTSRNQLHFRRSRTLIREERKTNASSSAGPEPAAASPVGPVAGTLTTRPPRAAKHYRHGDQKNYLTENGTPVTRNVGKHAINRTIADRIYEIAVEKMVTETMYYRETAECRHTQLWPERQRRVHWHTAEPEPKNWSVSVDRFPCSISSRQVCCLSLSHTHTRLTLFSSPLLYLSNVLRITGSVKWTVI